MLNMYNVNEQNDNKDYYEFYTIKKGDTLYKISQNYNVNPKLLAALNGLNMNDYIYPIQSIMVPKEGYAYYITKESDTLKIVADTFDISQERLIKNNPTIYLQEGQLLVNKIK